MTISTLIALLSLHGFSQTLNLTLAEKYISEGKPEQAKTALNEAVLNPQTSKLPRTWYLRAFAYKDLYKLEKGTSQISNDKAAENRKIAIESLIKCLELDTKGEFKNECNQMGAYLRSHIMYEASKHFEAGKYENCYNVLESYMNMSKSMGSEAKVDVKAYYLAGLSSMKMNNYGQAEKYLTEAERNNHDDPILYYFLSQTLLKVGKKQEALKILEKGFNKYPNTPNSKQLGIALYEMYSAENKKIDARNLLLRLVQTFPTDKELYILLALAFEDAAELEPKSKDKYYDEAARYYEKVLELDKDNLFANSNYGILLYNQGVNTLNELDFIDADFVKMGDVQGKALDFFKKSEPFLLKAYKLDPKRKETLEGLEKIYYVMGDFARSNEFKLLYQKLE